MIATSPSQRVTQDEDQDLREGEAYNVLRRGRHGFRELTLSSDTSVDLRDVNELSQCGKLHLGNMLDGASPEGRVAMDATTPEVSNEERDTSFALLDVNDETNTKKKLCTTHVSPSVGNGKVVTAVKKARKRPVNIWAKTSSRKAAKRNLKNGAHSNSKNARYENSVKEDYVCITLANKQQVNIEDGPEFPVVLSEYHKAEKVELSDDKLTASNTKGYRMVRATRGIVEGAWYFEILVENLGPSGHTRLGWSTLKGEIQAPVGFDNYSYAYRDVDGSKVHMAVREAYGQPYQEGDVMGFYINLPNGTKLAPKPETIVSYRGQPYILEEKEDPPKLLPGSEIAFFRNGIFQGTAFKDINAGRYFPAASMYTLPNDPCCVVTFNFGPNFRFPPTEIGKRPMPKPIACAPYYEMDSHSFGSISWKKDLSRLDAIHTLESQEMGEVIELCLTFMTEIYFF